MKTWNFKVNKNPQEIIKKLNAALGPANGFIFRMNPDQNNSVTFNVRKQSLNYLNFIRENQVIANGKALKTAAENESDVEISFTQHFLTIAYLSVFWALGLLAIIIGISSNVALCIMGGVLFAVGIALWIDVRKTFDRNIQNYKTLISEVLAGE